MKVIRCHEYLACNNHQCVMFSKSEKDYKPCWDTKETLCHIHHLGEAVNNGLNKKDYCDHCIYKLFLKGDNSFKGLQNMPLNKKGTSQID